MRAVSTGRNAPKELLRDSAGLPGVVGLALNPRAHLEPQRRSGDVGLLDMQDVAGRKRSSPWSRQVHFLRKFSVDGTAA